MIWIKNFFTCEREAMDVSLNSYDPIYVFCLSMPRAEESESFPPPVPRLSDLVGIFGTEILCFSPRIVSGRNYLKHI